MKNVNKDYLVEVNVKTAEIKAPRDMKFHITDIYTCNIFFKLVFDEPKRTTDKISISDYLDKDYMPKEEVVEYTLTLRILRPNDEPIDEIKVELLDQDKDFLYADLDPDCLNMLGIYECELFIDATVNGRAERNTTDSFEFEVVKSIFTDLSEAIESDPDYPLLADVYATKEYVDKTTKEAVKHMDTQGYATIDYVNQVAFSSSNMDLSDYVKDSELENVLSNIFKNNNITLEGYITDEEMKAHVAKEILNVSSGGTVDLSAYATNTALTEALEDKANKEHAHNDYVTHQLLEVNYATKEEIPTVPDSLPANGGHADTATTANDSNAVCGYSIYICTQVEYDAIEEPDPNTLYFVKEF